MNHYNKYKNKSDCRNNKNSLDYINVPKMYEWTIKREGYGQRLCLRPNHPDLECFMT